MNQTEIIISVAGALIMLLISLVGYLTNRQLQNMDDKVSTFDQKFLDLKEAVIEIKHIDKSALIKHLDSEVIPALRARNIEENMLAMKTEVTFIKEYQRTKIGPAVENMLLIDKRTSEQAQRIANQDSMIYKLYEIVKKSVEQKPK